MVAKSRKQNQKRKEKIRTGNTEPQTVLKKRSIHEKKTRPNMKGKMKIRMGHESADIYTGFEDRKGVLWSCPTCGTQGRVLGFCVPCSTGAQPAPAPAATPAATSTTAAKNATADKRKAAKASK
jgi:hypothetical protein